MGPLKTHALCSIGVMAAYDSSKVKVTVRVRYAAHNGPVAQLVRATDS